MTRWLLLAHQLPTRSSNARVKTWRRLQQLGAVTTRNSVYVLPNSAQAREDFEWIRSEIVALGGTATVFAADALNQDGEDDIVATFQRSRETDYRAIVRAAERLASAARRKRTSPSAQDALRRQVRALRERFATVERVDFFNATARQEAADRLAEVERLLGGPARATRTQKTAALQVDDFQNRRWVTRPRPGVDRMASAWLIRRYIDPKATFAFVEAPAKSDVAFDMYVGDFTHDGTLCTFEVLADRFGIDDPAVTHLAHIVHDLDMKETRYAPPEAPAVGRMIEGLRQLYADDQVLLQQGMAMFEALARSFGSQKTFIRKTRKHEATKA